jgi:chemotaxis protein methyltransferase CheR
VTRGLSHAPAPAPEQEIVFEPGDFRAIARIVEGDAGLRLTETSTAMVFARLVRHVRRLGMSRFSDFVAHVQRPEGREDRAQMVEAITTNTTRFFREAYHYDILDHQFLPGLIERARAGGRVRMWSAGCSTGEEAWSLAATVLRAFPDAGRHDVKILATDINRRVLARAERGIYPASERDSVPAALQPVLFDPGHPVAGELSIAAPARDLVCFRQLNFMEPWPVRGPFDVIFCRNVVIYMDKTVQAQIWRGLDAVLAPTGLLCIGHSERLGPEFRDRLVPCGQTAFRRP